MENETTWNLDRLFLKWAVYNGVVGTAGAKNNRSAEKIGESLRDEMGQRIKEFLVLAGNSLKRLKTDGPLFTLRFAVARLRALLRSSFEDRRRGISTEQIVREHEPEIADPQCHFYKATDYQTFDLAMAHVDICGGEDVFVDMGSGKGRVVILAAQKPFRRVIGVEFSQQLHAVALENLRVSRPRLQCQDVELLLADATQWRIPDNATVLFFYNPFHGEVLAKVCENIRRSLAEAPRALTIIYVRPEAFFEKEIAWQDWLIRTIEVGCFEEKIGIYNSRHVSSKIL